MLPFFLPSILSSIIIHQLNQNPSFFFLALFPVFFPQGKLKGRSQRSSSNTNSEKSGKQNNNSNNNNNNNNHSSHNNNNNSNSNYNYNNNNGREEHSFVRRMD